MNITNMYIIYKHKQIDKYKQINNIYIYIYNATTCPDGTAPRAALLRERERERDTHRYHAAR